MSLISGVVTIAGPIVIDRFCVAVTFVCPSSEAMTAASKLVTTLKFSDRYKALLPAILLNIKPALTQDRPEIERDYDAMTATVADAYTPYYNAMVDGIATVLSLPEAMEPLVDYYRSTAGEHPDWDDYRAAMERERRVLVRVELERAGPDTAG